MPTISCIIPTLGRGQILCATIEMLLAQSCRAHEIIVVDQTAAPDRATRERLATWHRQGDILWLHQSEPNASKARNAGALAATGEVILFLDDDILIKPDFLAAYAETFARTGALAVSGPVLEGDGKTVDELPNINAESQVGWLRFPRNYSKECETSFMMSGNAAVRREIFLALGGMDENYDRGAFREESDFAVRFNRAGHSFRFQPKASIYHLGSAGATEGGSRSWIRNKRIAGFHHCVGDWYFTLGFGRGRAIPELLRASLRHFVVNRWNMTHPWWLPVLFTRWLAALPLAAWRRLMGPKLIPVSDRV